MITTPDSDNNPINTALRLLQAVYEEVAWHYRDTWDRELHDDEIYSESHLVENLGQLLAEYPRLHTTLIAMHYPLKPAIVEFATDWHGTKPKTILNTIEGESNDERTHQ